jgi:hypothetical protein
MRSVRPVLRVDGYVRVSQVGYRAGERFISPSVQRDQIRGWAKARPATLLEVWEELGESGGPGNRPLSETTEERIEAGLSQGWLWRVWIGSGDLAGGATAQAHDSRQAR